MKTALLVIDMQRGSFLPYHKRYDTDGLVRRINMLTKKVRLSGGKVIFIQHNGPLEDPHHPDAEGWKLLQTLDVSNEDIFVTKTACDSFLNTDLAFHLNEIFTERVIITGCATDYCVDTTVRSALARGYLTVVPSNGHTTANRDHLDAVSIIAHHNSIWVDFISPAGAAKVIPSSEVSFDH